MASVTKADVKIKERWSVLKLLFLWHIFLTISTSSACSSSCITVLEAVKAVQEGGSSRQVCSASHLERLVQTERESNTSVGPLLPGADCVTPCASTSVSADWPGNTVFSVCVDGKEVSLNNEAWPGNKKFVYGKNLPVVKFTAFHHFLAIFHPLPTLRSVRSTRSLPGFLTHWELSDLK